MHICYALALLAAAVGIYALLQSQAGVRAELEDWRGEGGSGPVR